MTTSNGHSDQKNGHESDGAKLKQLIKGIKVAMMTTIDKENELRSRPMWTIEVEADGELWFFTDVHSAKAFEVRRNHEVNLSYASPDDNRYVSVSGYAQIVTDRTKIKELWSPAMKAFFPDGPESPDVSLLRIHIAKAEYWDSPSSKMVMLYGFAKALLTGERPYDIGDHGKLNLS